MTLSHTHCPCRKPRATYRVPQKTSQPKWKETSEKELIRRTLKRRRVWYAPEIG